MIRLCEQRLTRFLNAGRPDLLGCSRIGLEKETLRVSCDGHIAQTPHPVTLGAALTHPSITTDYSEALLEFITPPFADLSEALDFLQAVHRFVYQRLADERLWATSMPCVMAGEDRIPIAWYGTSHPGMMKHVYRRGLGYRYGRMMQVIAGVHFNYSLDEAFWEVFREQEGDRRSLPDFRSDGYFRLIRNLQRLGWLIPYLFGASPAVCKTFLAGIPAQLDEFDDHTAFEPLGTSLRLSDIGYTNRASKKCGLDISYDNLEAYLTSLCRALRTPWPAFEQLGVVVDGEYRQLNANLLQIEGEYYSTMRPKQPPRDDERPVVALRRRGVQYVELRSLDLSPFDPLGVNEEQLRFVEAFLLYCLLQESPPIVAGERREIDDNLLLTTNRGRDPRLELSRQGRAVWLRDWALEVLDCMEGLCEVLDDGRAGRLYTQSLVQQREKVRDPDRTPAARMLAEMRARGEDFFEFARRMSDTHRAYFQAQPDDSERTRFFEDLAERSWREQRVLEADTAESFPAYLQRYRAQLELEEESVAMTSAPA